MECTHKRALRSGQHESPTDFYNLNDEIANEFIKKHRPIHVKGRPKARK